MQFFNNVLGSKLLDHIKEPLIPIHHKRETAAGIRSIHYVRLKLYYHSIALQAPKVHVVVQLKS